MSPKKLIYFNNLSNHYFFLLLKKICVLHIGEGSSVGKITRFTLKTFQKCKDILKKRTERKLKYSNVKLPQDISDVLGYHIDCYRKFTALGKTDREELKSLPSDKQKTTKITTRHSNSSTHIVSPQTGIFQQKCIFCKQSEKKVKKQKQNLIQVATFQFESKIKEYARALSDEQI